MKKLSCLALFTLLFFSSFASAQCGSGCYFYSGDFDPNDPNANYLSNENDSTVPNTSGNYPVGAATYQNFDIDPTQGPVTVTGLFTNNMSDFKAKTTSAYWEICYGLNTAPACPFSGLASGANFPTPTATGRSYGPYTEWHYLVTGLSVTLDPKVATKWWLAVVPQDPTSATACKTSLRSFNSTGSGINRIGKETDNLQFWRSPLYTLNQFLNANTQGVFPIFSGGVCVGPGPC